MSFCSVILVTYNSEPFLDKAMEGLEKQTYPPSEVIIVDTGSKDKTYLKKHALKAKIIEEKQDVGFCKGNNTAIKYISKETNYLLFLNPDAFIEETFLEKALSHMKNHLSCGALTGQLLGYDIKKESPTGLFDSTGIFSTWYGRYYDRDQGAPVKKITNSFETIPAICGALFFCRQEAFKKVLLPTGDIFDPTFYMYKEDIDLSNRLKRAGWKLHFVPTLSAYHCRGWERDRKKMPLKSRLFSAKNELKIHIKERSFVGTCYSMVKYFFVRVFNQ